MSSLPPPPIKDPNTSSYVWQDWFRQLRNRANAALTTVTWSGIDFTGSNLTDILTKDHNVLTNKQGGTTGEYYHLTSGEYAGTSQSNIDAKKLVGKTWAVPDPIGSTTPAAGTFTNLTVNGNTTIGDSSSDTFTINPNAVTWSNNPTHSGNHTFSGNTSLNGNVTLGDSTSDLIVAKSNIIVPNTAGYGIKVDTASPVYTWRDLEGPIQPKASGAGSPTWTTYTGNIKEWKFVANDIVDLKYHWPHDHVPGTDVYIHIHWTHNGSNISGSATVDYRFIWGKRDGAYDAEKTLSQTITTSSIASRPTLTTFVDEIQLSATSPSASQIDTDNLEPDGLLKISLIVNTIPTITAGSFFIEYVDIHYQSTNIGTKNKASNFYT